MSVTEEQRVALWQWLEEHMGTERAATMRSMLPPSGWADLVTKHDLGAHEERAEVRFEKVDRRFEQIDQRFEQIDQRFEQVDRRFEQVDQRFEQLDRRLESMERRFDQRFLAIEGRFDTVHQAIHASSNRYVAWLLASHAALLAAAAAFGALG